MTDPTNTEPKSSAGVFFPPPLIYVVLFVVGILLKRYFPLVSLSGFPTVLLAYVLLPVGLIINFWSLALFLIEKTSPFPMKPTSKIVRSGPYRFTRNPMYAGLLLVYIGLCLLFDQIWALILTPAAIYLFNLLVIGKEESYLESKFGDDYLDYKTQTRRWF